LSVVTEVQARMVDVSYALSGAALPRDHRRLLADALGRALPWLAELPGTGVHRINVSQGGGPQLLLSQRSRLTLRVPRERVAALEALAGAVLDIGGHAVRLGEAATVRELLPHRTLYAHLVAAEGDDEIAFMAAVDAELAALGVPCRPICGKRQVVDDGGQPLPGFSLMLDGLARADALRLLETGLGGHRLLGCGLFVPHRSAAAVGS
jgi:CRISPR-associated protein Cas6